MPIGTSIEQAKAVLVNGGLVAIPTETVYGLAANALNKKAVLSVFKAKNRPRFDPLILHVRSIDQLHNFAEIPNELVSLSHNFWPGPLTLLLPKKESVSDFITAGSPLVAVRIPEHPKAQELLNILDFPLVAPSANPFGYVSPTNAQHVANGLGNKVDYILDGGSCELGIESTIVSFLNGKVNVHRLGSISVEKIEACIGTSAILNIQNNSNPKAPGMLDKHYSPTCKLRLYKQLNKPKVNEVLVWFGNNCPDSFKTVYNLSKSGSVDEAAQNLFSTLRKLDDNKHGAASICNVPNTGLGRAINDRIKRACS